MPDPDEDFTSVIERAQRVSKDIGGVFDGAGRTAFEPRQNRAAQGHDFEAHVKVFLLPTDAGDYEDVLNQILRGEAVLRYEERTFTKDGDFMVAVCFMTPTLPVRPANNREAGDAEPDVRPRRLP